MQIPKINVFSASDFRKWLVKNHSKEKIVELVIHKKHTGKSFPTHRQLMDEGICFGWIDTIIRRIDEDTFIRTFQRRSEKSNWSVNTLSYAKELIANGRMTPHGLVFYHKGKEKKAFDHGIPKNPRISRELKEALEKNKIAKENFENLTKSARRTYLRWLLYAKTQEKKKKRIDLILERMTQKEGKRNLF